MVTDVVFFQRHAFEAQTNLLSAMLPLVWGKPGLPASQKHEELSQMLKDDGNLRRRVDGLLKRGFERARDLLAESREALEHIVDAIGRFRELDREGGKDMFFEALRKPDDPSIARENVNSDFIAS